MSTIVRVEDHSLRSTFIGTNRTDRIENHSVDAVDENNVSFVFKWWKAEGRERYKRREEGDGDAEREKTGGERKRRRIEGRREKRCLMSLHETMKQLTMISDLIKSVKSNKLEFSFISDDADQRESQYSTQDSALRGDGEERALSMRAAFNARLRATSDTVSKIRSRTASLRASVRRHRAYQRELLRTQRRWQVVPRDDDRLHATERVASNTDLAVYCGPGHNKNCALSNKWNDAMFVDIQRDTPCDKESQRDDDVITYASSCSNDAIRLPRGLSLSIVRRTDGAVLSRTWLGSNRTSDSLHDTSVGVLSAEIFTLVQHEASEHYAVGRVSHPTVVRVPLPHNADLVFRLVHGVAPKDNEDDESRDDAMTRGRFPRWSASMLLENIQMHMVAWRTATSFGERRFQHSQRASKSASNPPIRLVESSLKLLERVCNTAMMGGSMEERSA